MIRAKLILTGITEKNCGGKILQFDCINNLETPEDQRFQKSWPWGKIEIQIDNPAAIQQFQLGKSYYADFSAAE